MNTYCNVVVINVAVLPHGYKKNEQDEAQSLFDTFPDVMISTLRKGVRFVSNSKLCYVAMG